MNTLYCASCAAANRYEIVKPKLCQSCHKPVEGTFISTAPVAVSHTPVSIPPTRSSYPSPIKARSTFTRANLRGGERAPLVGAPVQQVEESDFGPEEHYTDKDEIYARGQELAQTISADDFMVGSLEVEGGAKTFKFADLVREAQQSGGGSGVSKAPRQRRKK